MSLHDFEDMASAGWRAGLGLVTSPFMARPTAPTTARVDDEEPSIQYPLSSKGQYLHHRHSDWLQVRQIEKLRERQHKSTLSDIWDPPIAPGLGLYTSPNNSTPRTYTWASSGLASGPPSSVAGSATVNVAPRARYENDSTSHHQAPRLEVDAKPRLDQQQRQLQEVEQQMIVLRSEKEQLDERIATLKETEQHIKDNIVDLNVEEIQYHKRRKEAEDQLGPAQENLAHVVEQLEGARVELLSKGADLNALKATLAAQQKEAVSVQEHVTELQQTLSRTQEALILHGDQLKDTRRCCDDAQRELADLQTAKQSANAALEKEQRDLLSVKETLLKEKSSVSDTRTQLETLRQELSRLRTEVNTVKTGREHDGNKVKAALEQENNAKASLVALQAQIKDQQRERDAQATRHATEVQKAKDELQAITTSRDAINGQLEKAKARINNATKAMEDAERKQHDAEARATKAEVDLSKRIADAEKRATAADAAAARAEATATKTDERVRKAEEDLQQVIRSREEATLALQQLEAALKLAASKHFPEVVTTSQSEIADPGLSSTLSAEDNPEHGYDVWATSQASESVYETASNSSQSTTGKWAPVAVPKFNSSQFIPARRQGSTSCASQPPPIPAPPSLASAHSKPSAGNKPLVAEQAIAEPTQKPLSPPESPVAKKTSLPANRALINHPSTAASASTSQEFARLQPLDTNLISPPQISQEPTPPMTSMTAPGIITPAPSTSSEGQPTSLAKAKDKAHIADAAMLQVSGPPTSSNLPSSVEGPSGFDDVLESLSQQNCDDSSTASSTTQQGLASTMDVKATSFVPTASPHATPMIAQPTISSNLNLNLNLNAGAGPFVSRGKGAAESSSTPVHGGPPGLSALPASKSGKESSPVHRSTETSSPQSPTNAKAGPTQKLVPASLPLDPQLNTQSAPGIRRPDPVSSSQSPSYSNASMKKPDPAPSPLPPKEKETRPRGLGAIWTSFTNRALDIIAPPSTNDEGPDSITTAPVHKPYDAARDLPSNATLHLPELAPSSNANSLSTQMTAFKAPPPDGAKPRKATGTTSGYSKSMSPQRKTDGSTAAPTVSVSLSTAEVSPRRQPAETNEPQSEVQMKVADLVDISDSSLPESTTQENTAKDIVAISIPATVPSSQTETEPRLQTSTISPLPADEKLVEPISPDISLREPNREDPHPVEFADPTATPLPNSPIAEHQEEKLQVQVHQPLPTVPAQFDPKAEEQLSAKEELHVVPSAIGFAAVPIAQTAPAEITSESTLPPATTSVFSKRIDDLVIQVKPGANPFPVAIFEVIFPTEYTIPTCDDEVFGSEEDDVTGDTPKPKPHRKLSELS